MSKKLWIIIIAVVVLGGGGAGAFFMFGPTDESAKSGEELGDPGLVSMETFLVNIGGSDGERHAKLTLGLTVAPADLVEEIDADKLLQAKMRDRVLTLLSMKSYDQLISPLGKEGFRREIMAQLNPLLEAGEIREVLFSEFVVH